MSPIRSNLQVQARCSIITNLHIKVDLKTKLSSSIAVLQTDVLPRGGETAHVQEHPCSIVIVN